MYVEGVLFVFVVTLDVVSPVYTGPEENAAYYSSNVRDGAQNPQYSNSSHATFRPLQS